MESNEATTEGNKGSIHKCFEKHGYDLVRELKFEEQGRKFLVRRQEREYLIKETIIRHDEPCEVPVLKQFKHPYIVAYADSFTDDDKMYVVTQYCEGGDLAEKIREKSESGAWFSEEEILNWFVQLCLALKHIHDKNMIHRDIKPQNIFFTKNGYINLGHFGCLKVWQSDIWALGWVLCDLCTPDFVSDPMERLNSYTASLKGNTFPVAEGYSSDLQNLIKELLSVDLKDRPMVDDILKKPFLDGTITRNQLSKSILSFIRDYDTYFRDLEQLAGEWKTTTEYLEDFHRKATIGSFSGGMVSAAGGITAVVGAILTPFTLGASLIVTGVGVGVATAGGMTGAASNISNVAKQKTLREKLKAIHSSYVEKSSPIIESLTQIQRNLSEFDMFKVFKLTRPFTMGLAGARICRSAVGFAKATLTIHLASLGRLAAQAAKTARIAGAVTGAVSGVFLILDIAFIIKDAREIREIYRVRQSAAAEQLKSNILKSIQEMKRTHKEFKYFLNEISKTKEKAEEILEELSRLNHPSENP